MTKEQFVQACAELTRLGYHRNYGDNEYPRGDGRDYYYKTIERRMNGYEENRAVNQVLFRIWHFEEYRDRVPKNSLYSLEPVIMISRSISERIDLVVSYPKRSIAEIEELAVKFGKWADENIREITD